MVYYKTAEEIEFLRESCLIVCKALTHVASIIRPGITGNDIDKAAEEVIRDHGAVPGFKGYRGFPGTLCISRNEGVVHGIPNDIVFQNGDVISVDCGSIKNDFYGDSAFTFAIGEVSDEIMQLLKVTNTSLYLGIEKAIAGNRLGDISYAVQDYCERKNSYGVVRELVGHGIGRNLHESPEVPNYGRRGQGLRLKEGLTIAIEPMVNMGVKEVRQSDDGWTIITRDKKPSAHFEHSIAVQKGRADILSNHSEIEATLANNANAHQVGVLANVLENSPVGLE